MSNHQDPTFLVAESRDGKPSLGGKRRLVDGLDDALETASEIDGQAYALEPIEENAAPPKLAITHVQLMTPNPLDTNRASSDFFARVPNPHTCRPDATPDDDDLDDAA